MREKLVSCGFCYICIATAYFIVFGIFLIMYGDDLKGTLYSPTDYLYQISRDWNTTPFVSLSVTEDFVCPEGQTEVFSRAWFGMQVACDCLHMTKSCPTED